MNPLNTVRLWNLIGKQQRLILTQAQMIADQHQQLRAMQLEHARELQGMVSGWLINLEQPEVDVREDLSELEADLANSIAALEEHVL
jgi:hypothetical protein